MLSAFAPSKTQVKIPRLLDLFEGLALPEASSEKNVFLLLINNHYDGVGDFMHGCDIAKHIKPIVNDKGYQLIAFIHVHSPKSDKKDCLQFDIDEMQRKRAEAVKKMLESNKEIFDDYKLFESTNNKNKFDEDSKQLDMIIGKLAGAFEISFYYHDLYNKLIERGVSAIQIHEYGSQKPDQSFFKAPMGIFSETHESYGLKLLPNRNQQVDPLAILKNLHQTEPDFVEYLLSCQGSPSKQAVDDYFKGHVFCPGYIQSYSGAIIFILSLLYKYQNQNKTVDIHLPGSVVDKDIIRFVLSKAPAHFELYHAEYVFNNFDQIDFQPFQPKAIEFYPDGDKDSKDNSDGLKCRIITKRISKDEDYQSLYHISKSVAGCSGDNSISLVLLSQNFMFFDYKEGIISSFYKEFIKMAQYYQSCNKKYSELDFGYKSLIKYFNEMIHIKSQCLLCSDSDVESQLIQSDKNKLTNMLDSTEFFDACMMFGGLLNDSQMILAWNDIRKEILKHNFYDRLSSILTASVVLTKYQDEALTKTIASSASFDSVIEQLIKTNVQSLTEVCRDKKDQLLLVKLLQEFMQRHPDLDNSDRVEQLIRSYEPPAPEGSKGRLGL